MFKNSQITIMQESNSVHLTVKGVFNASLAIQLLHFMRMFYMDTSSIYIHTDSVPSFEPLGLNIFRYSLGDLKYEFSQFIFTGENASGLLDAWPSDFRPALLSKIDKNTVSLYF